MQNVAKWPNALMGAGATNYATDFSEVSEQLLTKFR